MKAIFYLFTKKLNIFIDFVSFDRLGRTQKMQEAFWAMGQILYKPEQILTAAGIFA